MQNLIVSEEINLEKFTEITDLDDESYAFEIFGGPAPLPKCQIFYINHMSLFENDMTKELN